MVYVVALEGALVSQVGCALLTPWGKAHTLRPETYSRLYDSGSTAASSVKHDKQSGLKSGFFASNTSC